MTKPPEPLTRPTLWLASQSPRRRAMISWLDLPVAIVKVEVDERAAPGESPREMATRLAACKAQAAGEARRGVWILAADTTVDLAGEALGKPRDEAEARATLHRLRGRDHAVHTGVALHHPQSGRSLLRTVSTTVWMREYDDAEIAAYVASRDPMDKAGAYAIQHPGFHPAARIARCYANVVGLPLCAVRALLRACGHTLEAPIPELCQRHFGYHCPQIDEGTPTGGKRGCL